MKGISKKFVKVEFIKLVVYSTESEDLNDFKRNPLIVDTYLSLYWGLSLDRSNKKGEV